MGLPEATPSSRICQAFEDRFENEHSTRHWFQKFKSGDLSLCDEPHSSRPQALKEALQAAIQEDSSLTCGEFPRQFKFLGETDLERVQQSLKQKEPTSGNAKMYTSFITTSDRIPGG